MTLIEENVICRSLIVLFFFHFSSSQNSCYGLLTYRCSEDNIRSNFVGD